MRPMRIALLMETGGPGGAEHMLLNLASGLAERGHDIVPIGPDDRSPWLADAFRARGFRPERYTMRRLLDVRCLRGIAATLRARGVDVVHSHEFTMGVYGAAAARMTSRPHVLTMHGGRYYAGRLQRRVALGLAARVSHAVVGVSSSAARDLRETLRLRPDAVQVIANGVPPREGDRTALRRELALADDELLLVAVGNLYPVKGHAVLLRALAALHAAQPDLRWRLAIAGRGGEEASLRELAATSGIEARVHLLGYRADVGDILAAADVYTMPSLSEGLPLALLEAMAAALPVVASATGGIPEAARAGEEALLVPPGDPAALSDALGRLVRDAELRRGLGAAAAKRAREEHGIDRMLDRYEGLYAALLAGTRGAASP